MLADSNTAFRLGVFAELAGAASSTFGRTALMKLCYFLQTLEGIPLGYDFTLYSYGPFDSEVLSDLQTAESLSVLESSLSHFPGGYSYNIAPSDNAAQAIRYVQGPVDRYKAKIDKIAVKFASRSASELELLSTIVFVDRHDKVSDKAHLMRLVKKIKPQFGEPEILRKIDWLKKENHLQQV